jgi:hypothetical protein
MRHWKFAGILLAACAQEPIGGAASSESYDPMLSMKHGSEPPRGNLTVDPDGRWLYTSMDACKFIEGTVDSAKVQHIQGWLDDDTLSQYVRKDGWNTCTEEQYQVRSTDQWLCFDDAITSESGKALIQLFHETADKVMWDGVKRECMGSGPGTVNVSDEAKESGKTQPPPPPNG